MGCGCKKKKTTVVKPATKPAEDTTSTEEKK